MHMLRKPGGSDSTLETYFDSSSDMGYGSSVGHVILPPRTMKEFHRDRDVLYIEPSNNGYVMINSRLTDKGFETQFFTTKEIAKATALAEHRDALDHFHDTFPAHLGIDPSLFSVEIESGSLEITLLADSSHSASIRPGEKDWTLFLDGEWAGSSNDHQELVRRMLAAPLSDEPVTVDHAAREVWTQQRTVFEIVPVCEPFGEGYGWEACTDEEATVWQVWGARDERSLGDSMYSDMVDAFDSRSEAEEAIRRFPNFVLVEADASRYEM
jgi:hypothetical protein